LAYADLEAWIRGKDRTAAARLLNAAEGPVE
jgi:hypothetical protein